MKNRFLTKRKIILLCILCSFGFIGVLTQLLSPYFVVVVRGTSMEPTYHDFQVLSFTKEIDNIQVDDIIVFNHDGDISIKRVSAVPGQKYLIFKSDYYGLDNYETKLTDETLKAVHGKFKKLRAEEFFVMGDNRGMSVDSIVYGPIQREEIVGKLIQ